MRRHDPAYLPSGATRDGAERVIAEGITRMRVLQEKLYAQDQWSVLIVLQALDAAGKDSAIEHVMSGVNPKGCEVHAFKAPSEEEIDHNFLWRTTERLPPRGHIGIFNRSYYEEVLVVRVHPEILQGQKLASRLITKSIWDERLEDIAAFERYLARNGVVILKFFLNVSRKEQKRRFLERLDQPDKNWKFSVNDAKERACWKDYMRAYEDVFTYTSTKHAPWYIIPADNKWFMRLAVAAIINETLADLKLRYPTVSPEKKVELDQARTMLLAEKG